MILELHGNLLITMGFRKSGFQQTLNFHRDRGNQTFTSDKMLVRKLSVISSSQRFSVIILVFVTGTPTDSST